MYSSVVSFSDFTKSQIDIAFLELFGDDEIAPQILTAEKPMQMKALGRKVKNFDENIWKENRERIVQEGNLAKVTFRAF